MESDTETMDCASIRKQLLDDNAFFKKMVELIPSRYTLSVESDETVSQKKGLKDTGKQRRFPDKHDMLRESLHKKLLDLQAKRLKPGAPVDSIEKKRLKRKLSKQKLRQRRKAEKQSKAIEGGNKPSDGKAKKSPIAKTKPIFNKEGKMVFSKFDFSDGTSRKEGHKSDVPTGKNYKALLSQAEKKKQKLDELARSDLAEARQLSQKELWKAALHKAEGVKVRDNPELLKKALKKHEKKKEGSRRKWESREETLSKQMQDRQAKRSKNIAKKKEGRANKKFKKAKKHGRVAVS